MILAKQLATELEKVWKYARKQGLGTGGWEWVADDSFDRKIYPKEMYPRERKINHWEHPLVFTILQDKIVFCHKERTVDCPFTLAGWPIPVGPLGFFTTLDILRTFEKLRMEVQMSNRAGKIVFQGKNLRQQCRLVFPYNI